MGKQTKGFDFRNIPIEIIFVAIGLTLGLCFVFVNPPFQTNDEDRHFFHAYYLSQGKFIPKVEGKKIGGELPNNLVNVVNYFQGIPFMTKDEKQLRTYREIMTSRKAEALKVQLEPANKAFYHDNLYPVSPAPYLPHAIGIAIGGIFQSNPVWLGWFGRIGGLICYLFILYFALKTAPVFKTIIFLYALTPMAIYQGSSVTYGMMANSVSFLLLALALKFSFEKNYKIKPKDLAVFILLTIVLFYSKSGIPLIPFIIFIVPPERFGSTKISRAATIAGLALLFIALYQYLVLYTWSQILPQASTDIRLYKSFGKRYTSAYVITHPFWTLEMTIRNIIFQRQDWVGGALGRFGYAYLLLPKPILIIHGLVLLFAAFLDGKPGVGFKWYQRLIVFIIGFGSAFITIVGAIPYMTPEGGELIFGLQGRYFVPYMPFILLFFYNTAYYNPKWERMKKLAAPVYIVILLIITLLFINSSFYV